MEAVKQGSACVGLRSNEVAVLGGYKRSASKLSGYQQKVFKIDEHMGIAMAGLTADARTLSTHMRQECLNHRFAFDRYMPSSRLVTQIANKAQVHTQRAGRRPYGVGLLIIAYDEDTGPRLYETCPSGNYFDYYAQAIGSRCQAARTYLEKTFDTYHGASKDQLIKHALLALRETISPEGEKLNSQNATIAVVGKDIPFTILENEAIEPYLSNLDEE